MITLVGQQHLGRGNEDLDQRLGSGVTGGLTPGQDEAGKQSLIVCSARLRLGMGHGFCQKTAA
jgi:hypothetical protein